MLFFALRRLVGLAIAFALVTAVANNLGPGLAARSMNGFMAGMDAAEAGDTARADAIGGDLARQWGQFEHTIVLVVKRAQTVVSELAP